MIECDECGREFGSPRGLAFHKSWHSRQGQEVADDDDTEVEVEVEEGDEKPAPPAPEEEIELEDEPPSSSQGVTPPSPPPEEEPPTPEPETPPEAPTTSVRDRARRWWSDKKSVKGGKGRKRVPLDEPAGWAWGQVGTTLIRSDISPAAGRVMTFQGPIVGPVVDDLMAGTILDRMIQPVMQQAENWKALSGIVALPVAAAIAERNPASLSIRVADGKYVVDGWLAQPMYDLIAQNIELMGPVVKQKKRDTERRQKIMAEVFPELIDQGVDPVLFVMASIFPQEQAAPPAPTVDLHAV